MLILYTNSAMCAVVYYCFLGVFLTQSFLKNLLQTLYNWEHDFSTFLISHMLLFAFFNPGVSFINKRVNDSVFLMGFVRNKHGIACQVLKAMLITCQLSINISFFYYVRKHICVSGCVCGNGWCMNE